ncbi:hypothetical protein R3P38DRAFT_976846 [Favolaschia claudopus]|uniref:Uncharacterized protein n=1 Tax=Favolaschia claudopus TaxID=2862362 RepID=A0AAW0E8C4_9AGAR
MKTWLQQLGAQAELAELFVLLADARTTNALAHSAYLEVPAKHFQILIRYLIPVVLSVNIHFMTKSKWSDDTCHTFLFVQLVAGVLMILLSDLVLAFRVWILYRRSKLFMYFLAGLLTAEFVVSFTLGFFAVKPLSQYVQVGPLLAGCYPLAAPRLLAFYALPPLLMSISMFILTAYKCGSTILALGHRNAPILSVFMRDGFFWFLSLVVLRVAEIIIWNRGRVTLVEIPVVPGTAATAMISARVILNLKQMTSEPSHSVVSGETVVGTELEVRRAGPASKINWETSHDLD